MESSDLRVFQMVAREGSVTKAAARLGYVQSNVTARIRHLENELGTPLFLRHNRGMTLSAGGRTLLEYADKVVGLLDEAALALSSALEPAGPLRLGSTQTAAALRLPGLLTAYHTKYPNVRLSLETGHSPLLMEKVLHYELDAAFVGIPCEHPDLQSVAVFEEEVAILSAASMTSLEEAVAKPILVYNMGCSYREVLEKWVVSGGHPQPVVMELGTLEAIIGGVAAGLGITLLPRAVAPKQMMDGTIRAHALPDSINRMKTEFVTRKDSFAGSALRAFMAMLPETWDAAE
ncbi:LysR family transcriptional regulator [Cohnella sp. CFH 77786]|uniref:LysR family transcriptional regulator n=1 Tax=Cohnella sp. CFH 77786 TaxID=2662265 RepID=UPI001C609643|nr:LysR family transcriptional regulator [Cohnella sp. CFH 77786]MBW5446357.1 LysR family transcriptional regulator [Cohnella sp. CFH 77786]